MLPKEINCPNCGSLLELEKQKREAEQISCPACNRSFDVSKVFLEPVTVHIPKDEADHLAIVALLEGEGIQCYSKNAGVQNLFGAGQIGTGFNIAAGAIQIQVSKEDVERAKEILSAYSFQSNEPNKGKIKAKKANGSFGRGTITGFLLCATLAIISFFIFQQQPSNEDYIADLNGDGNPDYWAEYSNDKITSASYDSNFDGREDEWEYFNNGVRTKVLSDRNFDGREDCWEYFDRSGIIINADFDYNFDGNPDEWVKYKDNISISYRSDNDYDGKVDEWGSYEHEVIKERFWSFEDNMGVIDNNGSDIF